MSIRILTSLVQSETDVVLARQRAKQIAALCGFGPQDQVRIATSVSELARNIINYAGRGHVYFAIEGDTSPQVLMVQIEDKGPGIQHLDVILSGEYKSPTGMGMGIIGARRLADRFDIQTAPGKGTKITLKKIFPRYSAVITPEASTKLFASLAKMASEVSVSEVMQQNQELLAALTELKARQDDLIGLTRELEDTNRGMVALYAELDEKAGHLRRADQMKSRFLSNMSHEFRTPLSSIRALAKLLLDRVDGELAYEQEKQVGFILQSANDLNELVNDLLDIAKIEAGKVNVYPTLVDVNTLFSALRGMLRPLLISESLKLTFTVPDSLTLFTDEAKLSQILRNFISNALKFTEAGEIVVSAVAIPEKNQVVFSVADTGVGISEADQQLIFEEFSQIENPLQRKVKGTGLGLPLCRNLAKLLHGDVSLVSAPGVGSTFSVTLPATLSVPDDIAIEIAPARVKTDDLRKPILIVEDNLAIQSQYEKYLYNTEYRGVMARNLREAAERWAAERPAAVILDIVLHGEDSWLWLAELKNDPARSDVPVIIVTEVEDKRKGFSLGADAYHIKPLFKQQLLSTLQTLVAEPHPDLAQDSLRT